MAKPLTTEQQDALTVLIDYYGYGRGLTGMRLDNLLYWKYVNMRALRGLERRGYIVIDTVANWVTIGAVLINAQIFEKGLILAYRLEGVESGMMLESEASDGGA